MCGILFTNDPLIKKEKFLKALELMRHRGPDKPLCYQSFQDIQMGHNRLKIIDLDDRSSQPFLSQDKDHLMIFNGEVYNYLDLKKKYRLELRTTSDTEVIIELFSRFGPRILPEFNGMFAIVIVNKTSGDIFIARDRLGVKPLYMLQRGQYVSLASEIAPLLEFSDKTDLDPYGIRQYKKLRTFFNGRTLYKNIKMFPAGYYSLNGALTQYWKFPREKQAPPADAELKEFIQSAVDYRCISDVPVGSYLSGGLDSTIVAALAGKPHTWTVGFDELNEFEWGRLAADTIHSQHHEVKITTGEFLDLAKHMIKIRKEPLSVPNEVLLYKMTTAVKKENTVILSGEGADELFFGYDRIFRWANEGRWDIKEFDKYYSYGTHQDLEIVEEAVAPFLSYGRAIDIVAAFFQVAHLHGLLRRLDNATMLCAVEARVPFVDYRLIERMAGVSFEYRMEGGVVKMPLKRIFGKIIPEAIIKRSKIGFPVPLEKIPFNVPTAEAPMDKWLDFNLQELGMDAKIYL